MPLDTSIIRQATFQPIQFKSPDRVNMLLQAAQAAQAVQGLQAGREEREARIAGQQRAAQTQAALQEARKLGYTDEAMLSMSDALIGSGVPDLVNKGITLRESLREAAEYRRAFGVGGAPAGAAAMPSPAGAVATPAPVGVGAPQLTSGVNERGLAFPTTQEGRNQAWADIQAGKPLPPAMSPVAPLQSIMPTAPAAPVAGPGNAMAARAPVANQLAAQPPAEGDFLQTAEAAIDPNAPQRARLAQLLQHPQKNIREAAAASLGAMPGVTAEQKAYLTAVRQGFRGTMMEYQTALKKAGATSVTTKVDAFVPASEQAQGDYIKAVSEERKALRNAADTLKNVEGAKALIPTASTFMGTGGQPLLAAASFLNNRLGFSIATQGVTDATVLRTRLFEGILENLKKLDSQPSQEQQRVLSEALGNLGTDPAALPQILDRIAETMRDRVARYNQDVTDAEKRGVKFPYKPQIDLPPIKPGPAAIPSATPSATPAAAVGAPIFATNPQTGQRIMSRDGGNTWTAAPAR